MGCCCSALRGGSAAAENDDTEEYPLPVIAASDGRSAAIFDPEFSPNRGKSGSPGYPEAERLLDGPADPVPKPPIDDLRRDDNVESDSPVDQDMIQKLLAEVDTSDLSD